MSKKKRTIDSLCGENTKLPVWKRYKRVKVDQYVIDLKRILQLEKQGKARPSRADMQEFFSTELGVKVSQGTIDRHLTILKRKEKLWPEQ